MDTTTYLLLDLWLSRFRTLISEPITKYQKLVPRLKFLLQRTLHRFCKANLSIFNAETGFIETKGCCHLKQKWGNFLENKRFRSVHFESQLHHRFEITFSAGIPYRWLLPVPGYPWNSVGTEFHRNYFTPDFRTFAGIRKEFIEIRKRDVSRNFTEFYCLKFRMSLLLFNDLCHIKPIFTYKRDCLTTSRWTF